MVVKCFLQMCKSHSEVFLLAHLTWKKNPLRDASSTAIFSFMGVERPRICAHLELQIWTSATRNGHPLTQSSLFLPQGSLFLPFHF